MKLEIWRNQKDVKGLLGGHKGVSFSLVTRVQVTPDEQGLITKYKVGEDTLVTYQLPGGNNDFTFRVSVNEMIAGHTVDTRDIATMIDLEDTIKSRCQNLKTWLAVMATFGGYEAVEF